MNLINGFNSSLDKPREGIYELKGKSINVQNETYRDKRIKTLGKILRYWA